MQRTRKIIKVSVIEIIANFALVIVKALIGFFSNSIAIILDAVNNLTDTISSIVVIIGAKIAGRKPDHEHPYGHGRVEYITAAIVSLVILYAGVMAVVEAFKKIISGDKADYSIISIIIVALAILVKICLGLYVKKSGKKLNCSSLINSGQDSLNDAILSFSTLVAAILNFVWGINLEAYLAIFIALFIIKSAFKMLSESIDLITGVRAEEDLVDQLRKKVEQNEEVQGVYDISLHNYGPTKIVGSANIQVRDDMTAAEIHELTRNLSMEIYERLGIVITFGIYAENNDENYKRIKKRILELEKEHEEIKQVHGFYVTKEDRVFFDMVVDFNCKNPKKIRDLVVEDLEKKFPKYNFFVILDADVSG